MTPNVSNILPFINPNAEAHLVNLIHPRCFVSMSAIISSVDMCLTLTRLFRTISRMNMYLMSSCFVSDHRPPSSQLNTAPLLSHQIIEGCCCKNPIHSSIYLTQMASLTMVWIAITSAASVESEHDRHLRRTLVLMWLDILQYSGKLGAYPEFH